MHLHWLIFFLVSLGVANLGPGEPQAVSENWKMLPSEDTFQGRVSQAEPCNDTEYAKAKIELWEHLGLDNDSQNSRKWSLMYNYNHDIYYAKNPAKIYVDLYVTSIINVNEKAQSLTTQVKMITAWPNLKMMWNYMAFCGIKTFAAPKNMFWTPDIVIMESIKTDFGTKESPNVLLFSFGYTASYEVLSLTTACKMDLYRFPFDIQTCSITLQSTSYSNLDITLEILTNQTNITSESKKTFQAQGEWELIDINETKATMTKWIEVDQLIYQIIIKRRPILYVINIIVPVFFFLVLDVISFFIDTCGANKVSFKVTLLLSISVMLLLVNNTLPSTSEQIPLIGIYCCTIFCLIGISMVETILVNFLKAKGDKTRSVETTAAVTGQDDSVRDQQNPPDSVRDQNDEQSNTINLLSQILTEVRATNQQNQRQKLSWTGVAKIIDVTFLVLYIISIIVFMSVLWKLWYP